MARRLNDRGTPPNFDYTPRTATVYRFHDRVAVHLGDGATAYMTKDEARALADILLKVANNIGDGVRFSASLIPTWNGTVNGRGEP